VLSASVWLDIVALWPMAAVGLVATPVVWLATGRRDRHQAIAGLSLLTWLIVGLALHLAAADFLPVAATTVLGPPDAPAAASLVVDMPDAVIDVGGVRSNSYRVAPLRTGGNVAAPSVLEQVSADAFTVAVVPRSDAGVFRFGGWAIGLGDGTTWTLRLAAGELDLDLTGVALAGAALRADRGVVRLGQPEIPSTVSMSGTQTVIVPRDVPVLLRGEGRVPADWSLIDGGGAESPTPGDGWTLVAESGSTVVVSYG
jgi:hypothetical protein